jgi:hypothetical protein
MNEIICPHCKKAFKVDEAGYADILKQVRDHKFEEEISNRLELAEKDKENAIQIAEANFKIAMQEQLANKENELNILLATKQSEISQLQGKISNSDLEKKLAVNEAINIIERERDDLANAVKFKETEKELLKSSLIDDYSNQLREKDIIIKLREEEITLRKDMKLKLSTKMIGESLEKHCEDEFNKLRSTAFQKAEFEKDNDAKTGSKGDFIFREYDDLGNEIISIMFEMKNEGDETEKKKKNEDFLKELDKDRNEKKCEYAVLVSLLEADSEFYNTGIVDVSHKFSKMYVVRPQFFIPIISLLRNAAINSLQYKAELALVKSQNVDITNFEEKLKTFRDGFSKNYDSAKNHFQKAIKSIDISINAMQKVKEELTASENQLRLANSKADGLTIKGLTHNNPTMKSKFNNLK